MTAIPKPKLSPQRIISLRFWELGGSLFYNLFVLLMVILYLFPISYIIVAAFTETAQMRDPTSPLYPARQKSITYEGKQYWIYHVPTEQGTQELALVKRGRTSSQFLDPQNPEAGLVDLAVNWRSLKGSYRFYISLENYKVLLSALPFGQMLRNTFTMTLIGEIGVLISSIIVAYGFARFPLPGGNLLFYVLIATLLIPEKITLIPTYFIFVRILRWQGTWLPLLAPLFFGNAVYIFLLRQNFKSIPKDLDEAAKLDGAGPLRVLFSVILPQSWPVVTTVSLLHFYYAWNETRQASLYLSISRTLSPLSFGVQNYQSLQPEINVLEASALLVMIVPAVVLFLSQRFFMEDMIVTGLEK